MPKKVVILGTAHPHIFGMAGCVRASNELEIVGVWDDDAVRRRTTAEKLAVPEIATLDGALALGPAVALTAAVPGDRVWIIEQTVAAGVPIFVDKPLAVTHQALDRIIATQRKHGKPVVTYYPYRGHPDVLAAKALVDAGEIGKLVRVFAAGPHRLNAPGRPAWHWTAKGNGGCLIDIGSHHIDLCCWFAGAAPAWVSALHGNFSQPQHQGFQDFGQAQLRFPSDVLGHVEVDWLNPASIKNFGDTRIWLQGTTGKIEIRHGDVSTAQLWNANAAGQTLDQANRPGIDAWTTALVEELASGGTGPIPQEEIWRTSRVSLHAFDSAQAGGRPVQIG